jgi:hypothetical protein
MKLVSLLQEKQPDSGLQQGMLLAAYVEMVEPSIPNSKSAAAMRPNIVILD